MKKDIEAQKEGYAIWLTKPNAYAHTADSELRLSWSQLREAKAGDSWSVTGSGSLYRDTTKVTVLYCDDEGVFLRFRHTYSSDSRSSDETEVKYYEFV